MPTTSTFTSLAFSILLILLCSYRHYRQPTKTTSLLLISSFIHIVSPVVTSFASISSAALVLITTLIMDSTTILLYYSHELRLNLLLSTTPPQQRLLRRILYTALLLYTIISCIKLSLFSTHLHSTTTIQGIKELTTTTYILSLILSSLTLYATAHATSNLITEAKEAALPASGIYSVILYTDATRFLITSSVEAYKYFTRLTPSSTSTTRVNEDVVLGTVVVWALSLSLIIPTLGGLRKWVGGGGTSAGFAVGSKVFWGVSSGSGSDSVVGERALTDSTV